MPILLQVDGKGSIYISVEYFNGYRIGRAKIDVILQSKMDDAVELYASEDEELNPSPQGSFVAKKPVKYADSTEEKGDGKDKVSRRRRKSRWAPAEQTGNISDEIMQKLTTPHHWQEVSTFRATGLGETLVQKSLFADAVCGTSTPHWMLQKVLQIGK